MKRQLKSILCAIAATATIVLGSVHETRAQRFLGRVNLGSNAANNFRYQHQFNNGASGTLSRQGNSTRLNGSQFDRNGHGWQGSASTGRSGSRLGYSQTNRKGTTSGYVYRNQNSQGLGGAMPSRKQGTSWDAGVRLGKGTGVQVGKTQPGPVAGTQTRTWADVNVHGRNSRISAGRDLSIAGGRKIGSNSVTLNRNGVSQHKSANVGGARGSQDMGVRFKGHNSEAHFRQEARVGPVHGERHATVNRKGASGGVSVGVGKAKVEAKAKVSTSGTSFTVGGRTIRF